MTVLEIFEKAAATFKDRNGQYGAAYLKQGDILAAMFTEGITLKTPDDFRRFCLFTMIIGKMNRYSEVLRKGEVHLDSVHDAGVYSFMLESVDSEMKKKSSPGEGVGPSSYNRDGPWYFRASPEEGFYGPFHSKEEAIIAREEYTTRANRPKL